MGAALRRIQVIERQLADRTDYGDDGLAHLRWWSWPILPGEFRRFCNHRARERLQVEGGPCWYTGITEDERKRRQGFEADELARLQDVYGAEEGWAAWHDQARFWPQQYGSVDEAALERGLMHAFEAADTNRSHYSAPLWRQVWPEWRPGMSLAEHLAFDHLLGEEGQARCDRMVTA